MGLRPVDDVESGHERFRRQPEGLGRPETEAGQQAKESLDRVAGDIEENVSKVRTAVDGASGVSGIVAAADTANAALSTTREQVSSPSPSSEDWTPGSQLKAAFSEADLQ